MFWGLRHGVAATAAVVRSVRWTQAVGALALVLLVGAPFAPRAATASSAGEVVELRTATSTTFRNADGSLTTHLYPGSVHFREGGAWVDIDNALVADGNGYAVVNKANRFHAHFKDALEDDYLRLDVGGQSFSLSPVGAARAALRAAGASASYGGAFDHVDLRYDVLSDAVKETLVLQDATGPSHYRFFLSTPAGEALTVSPAGDGSFVVTGSERDTPAFTIAAPEARDADGAVALAGHGVSLDVTQTGDRYAIDLDVDSKWLHDPARVFPVEVDPTLTIQPPVQNGSWDQGCATCAPTGGTRLSIGSDATKTWRSGLLFDLGAIPVGANISDAQLKVYYDGTCLGTCATTALRFDALKMTSFWTVSTTTQNVSVDPTALSSATLAVGAAPQWLQWNVTSTVDRWRLLQETNFGLVLKNGTEGAGKGGISVPSASFATVDQRPRLDVTYVDDGLELQPPNTLHSSGADLLWTPYADPGGAPFDRYEIHRSRGSGDFTPSASTLIATIRDATVTTYADRTAAAGGTFTYKVVANGSASSTGRTVTLPADGRATKALSTATADGRATYLVYNKLSTACGNYGSVAYMKIGSDATYVRRPTVKFDLRDIPADASVTDATLSLFQWTAIPAGLNTSVSVHRITSDWQEGTSGSGACTGDGATWYETYGGVKWATAGGDFDAANEGTPKALTPGALPTWHDFPLTSLVQKWVNGDVTNLGVLLKLDDETQVNGRVFNYESEDYTVAPTLRPKLTVTYADGSHAVGPTVSVASPVANDTVSGSSIALSAAASDDSRIAQVEFLVDGSVVGTDTTAPFGVTWNSTTAAAGDHLVSARATDDAGNPTTSASVKITVDNSAPPATSVTSMNAAYASEVAVDVPSAYWRLGDAVGSTAAADASGNGVDGTYDGATVGSAGGLANDDDTAAGFAPSGGAAPAAPSFAGADAFASATTIVGGGGTVSGTNTTATKEAGEPNHAGNTGGHSVWWRWTAPAGGTVTVNTASSSFDTVLAVYTGTAFPLTTIASNDDVAANDRTSRVSFTAAAGTTYRIAVDGFGGGIGTYYLTWTQAGAPANDLFASSQALSGSSGGTTASNSGATKETGEPGNAGNAGGKSIWYTWTAPATAPVTVDTLGSTFDTTLGVYTGSSVGGLTTIAGDDDSGPNFTSAVTFNASAGTVYRISVDGYNGVAGEISLRWAQGVSPSVALGDRFDFAGASSFSVEAWVKPTTVDATSRRIVSKEADDAAGHQGWSLSTGSAGLVFNRYRDGLANTVSYATGLPSNAWSHVVATYDGAAGTMVLYVNGTQVATAAGASKLLADTTSVARIGRNAATGADAFAGSVDEVAVYAVALPAARVGAHRDAGTGKATTVAHATVTVNATASDDRGVSKVEFYVDSDLIGTDTVAPYRATWNTLDPVQPSYDGAHALTTKAYDAAGQVTTSSALNVTVDNAGAASQYHASFTSTDIPLGMTYDPGAAIQDQAGVDVTVANVSTVTWNAANVVLRYRWLTPEGGVAAESPDSPFGANIAPNGTKTLRVLVTPPTLPNDVDRGRYTLRFDLLDKATGSWFAARGSQPLDNQVIVNKALVRDALGLERYYHYTGQDIGAGMQQLTNIANGNSLLRWTPYDEPGRGLATVVDLTYNALEKKCNCPAGNNFSLSISSLSRLGEPIDIHPNKADQIAGRSNKFVEITDGDGTTHRFTDANNDGYWEAPAGVHLYLRPTGSTDPAKYWAFTRPDRVTFYYDQDGFPTSVVDGNNNAITFTETAIAPGDDPGPVKKHVTKVTDAGNRSFDIVYYTKADAKKPQIRGKIKQITDHLGRALQFDYYYDGNLLRITQKGGANPDGSTLADRTFVFTYTTSDGSGPAITGDRSAPDPKTSNESTRLYSVRDPRGHETTFAYLGPGFGTDRWKLASSTDRLQNKTTYAYDTTNRVTTVTEPLGRVSKYAYDVEGKVTKITNPLNQDTTVAWSGDRAVARVTEPTGVYKSFAYNDNGYLTSTTDQLGNTTQLTFDNTPVDANDVAAKWETGRSIPHISDPATKTDPKGVATTTVGDYQWTFAHDSKGNVTGVTDPLGKTTTNAYNGDGTLLSTTDANTHTTTYPTYDLNGLATAVVDPLGNKTTFVYDAAGQLSSVQDPVHQSYTAGDPRTYRSVFGYDPFGRMVRQTAPKSTSLEPGNLIWSSATYDENDNVVSQTSPHYGLVDSGGGGGDVTTSTFDSMDRMTAQVAPHDPTATDPAQQTRKTTYAYDAAGRLIVQTDPKGVSTTGTDKDFATFNDYDLLDRIVTQTRYSVDTAGTVTQTQRARVCLDLAGDVRSVTAPKGEAAFPGCPAPTAPYTPLAGNFTTSFTYNAAHQLVSTRDAVGHTQSVTYDANGAPDSFTDENGTRETRTYNQRGDLVQETQPLHSGTPAKDVVTVYEYDPVGNLKREISPRGYDASTDKQTFSEFAKRYEYDAGDRLVREVLPTSIADPEQLYVHHAYDANGNQTWTSLTTDQADPALVALSEKSSFTYFDSGWVHTSKDPAEPLVTYDYSAKGQQSSRARGTDAPESWTYFADGDLKQAIDPDGSPATYGYDANDNVTAIEATTGVHTPDESTLAVQQTYDGFDRRIKTRQQKLGKPWHFTTYGYDLNGNVISEEADGTENADGSTTAGRKTDLTYDGINEVVDQVDHGMQAGCGDDQRIQYTYFAAGEVQDETVSKPGVGCTDTAPGWTVKLQTSNTYFLDGAPKTMKTWSGPSATAQLVQSHSLSYEDTAGRYLNGNIASDTFTLAGPVATVPCQPAGTCTTTYSYDAKDRLIRYDDNRGGLTSYTMLANSMLKTETFGSTTKTFEYNAPNGVQLKSLLVDSGGATTTQRFFYKHGNLVCTTQDDATASTVDDCPDPKGGTISTRLTQTYAYDDLDRLKGAHTYASGAETDSAQWSYDALDRVSTESETHAAGSISRLQTLDYIGLSGDVAREVWTGSGATTKSYAYDAFGNKASLTDSPSGGTSAAYLYGYNGHGDVSQLLDASGKAAVSYGYRPYGDEEPGPNSISRGDTDGKTPLNPYRFNAMRADSGAGAINMGARFFSPSLGSFLQEDYFRNVLDDVDLATDPLTGTRYGFTGANPINFVEVDGHDWTNWSLCDLWSKCKHARDAFDNAFDRRAKESVKGLAFTVWNSVNFTNQQMFRAQWGANVHLAWTSEKCFTFYDPDACASLGKALAKPTVDCWKKGGFFAAAGCASFDILSTVLLTKGAASARTFLGAAEAGLEARVASWSTEASSRKLAENLAEAGQPRPTGGRWYAHHIVAGGDPRALPARRILAKFGIRPNAEINGAWIDRGGNHTNAYYETVNRRIAGAARRGGKRAVIAELRQLKAEIEAGILKTGR